MFVRLNPSFSLLNIICGISYTLRLPWNSWIFHKGWDKPEIQARDSSHGDAIQRMLAKLHLLLLLLPGMQLEDGKQQITWSLQSITWIPWNLSLRYIHCTGQFTPKMKANAEPRLLSSLVWIDQYSECNGVTSFMEFITEQDGGDSPTSHFTC